VTTQKIGDWLSAFGYSCSSKINCGNQGFEPRTRKEGRKGISLKAFMAHATNPFAISLAFGAQVHFSLGREAFANDTTIMKSLGLLLHREVTIRQTAFDGSVWPVDLFVAVTTGGEVFIIIEGFHGGNQNMIPSSNRDAILRLFMVMCGLFPAQRALSYSRTVRSKLSKQELFADSRRIAVAIKAVNAEAQATAKKALGARAQQDARALVASGAGGDDDDDNELNEEEGGKAGKGVDEHDFAESVEGAVDDDNGSDDVDEDSVAVDDGDDDDGDYEDADDDGGGGDDDDDGDYDDDDEHHYNRNGAKRKR
jgi:hypothetical protein